MSQLLKYIMFYDLHDSLNMHPKYTEWVIKFAFGPKLLPYSKSCGLYALKYVELLLSEEIGVNMTLGDFAKYTAKLSKTIYKFSTDNDVVWHMTCNL